MKYIIESERLGLRKFRPSDAERLYNNHLEEEVKRWIPGESYADLEETVGAIDFYVARVESERLPYVLAVELKESGELIGDTGVNYVKNRSDQVEIGYTICKKHSGKGCATELLGLMTEFMFEKFGIKSIYGRVMNGNDASVRVLEKNGYTFLNK